jgi:cation transport regulator
MTGHDSSAISEVMPYASNADLPPSVRSHLPEHAQSIYREAFNHAFAAHSGDVRQEEAAHRIAWAAVKRSYVKVGSSWIARSSAGAW